MTKESEAIALLKSLGVRETPSWSKALVQMAGVFFAWAAFIGLLLAHPAFISNKLYDQLIILALVGPPFTIVIAAANILGPLFRSSIVRILVVIATTIALCALLAVVVVAFGRS